MQKQTVQLIWLFVEVGCIIRSALATFNVTMSLSGNDTVFSVFTVAVIELSLFAMLLMANAEAVAPLAALVLIAFSAVLQFAELALLTGTMDAVTKDTLRYAVSFAPTILLLVGLVKRLTSDAKSSSGGGMWDAVRRWFAPSETTRPMRSLSFDVEDIASGKRARKCSECAKTFSPRRSDQLTCSANCRRTRSRRLTSSTET